MRVGQQLSVALTCLLSGCAAKAIVTSRDVDDVMAMSAAAAHRRFPEYCIASKVEAGDVATLREPGPDGWSTSSDGDDVRYRRVKVVPIAGTLARTTANLVSGECDRRHMLIFQEPEFVEVKKGDGAYLEAFVGFVDRCPVCGGSFSLFLRRRQNRWLIERPGVVVTAIS